MGLKYREISQNLTVSVSTVARIVDRFERTGEVTRSVKPATERILHEHDVFVLMQIVLERPSVYLHELQRALAQTTGMFVSEATICRTIKRFGFSRKKMKYTALQRSDLIRAEYQAEIAIYDPSMLVFVDESGTDQRNAIRHFGYALRGYSPRSFKFLSRGKRLSAIAALTVSKLLCYELHEQNVDGDTFYLFVQRTLLPTLLPFNGYNPNSVVVMDNCSIHHVPEVIELIRSVGTIVVFLPPYSPDFTPIEEMFSKIKNFVRQHETVFEAAPKEVLSAAFDSVTEQDCIGWYKDCGYV